METKKLIHILSRSEKSRLKSKENFINADALAAAVESGE